MCLQVFTSDHALKLDWIPKWIAIIGSGYIGLEFSDVYTALGSEVTFIEVWRCKRHFAARIRHLHCSHIKSLSQGSSMRNCHVAVLHLLIVAACARYVCITSISRYLLGTPLNYYHLQAFPARECRENCANSHIWKFHSVKRHANT